MKKTLTNILRNSFLAGSFTLGYVVSDGCYNHSVDNYKQASSTDSQEYSGDKEYDPTLEDFKKALGDRYIPEREAELRNFWEEGKKYKGALGLLVKLYKDPEEIKRRISSDELKKRFETSYIYSVLFSKLKEIQNEIPWRVLPEDYETLSKLPEDYKFTESDEMIINAHLIFKDDSIPISIEAPFGNSPLGKFYNCLLGF